MKLIYRGQTYEYTPGVFNTGNAGRPARQAHRSQAPYSLTYRGVTFEVDPSVPQEVAQLPTHYNLSYRGATYHVGRDRQSIATIAPQVANAASVSIPSTMPRHYIGKVHQANLLENVQRRLKVAQSLGDQRLVELLEAERQQITA
ncbi:MAG: DUF4278 domain-containing protein [Drouetiella hepatica Uher 2000/2452]|jgi:hypothetical protein|uniref:DUF4278 domain-containing protein n=1 Tax=Drouetiella hepatica Uher 2000/2452 TaxID=904376 RepID=A0A951QF87_9CYAN|nr:DUF4278 domain-containing protein [Drouetiella hepatica Uher 2000/2452]